MKHHWGGGLAALGFGPDWMRTLVSMATDSSHGENLVTTLAPSFLIDTSLFLQVTRASITFFDGFDIRQDPTRDL